MVFQSNLLRILYIKPFQLIPIQSTSHFSTIKIFKFIKSVTATQSIKEYSTVIQRAHTCTIGLSIDPDIKMRRRRQWKKEYVYIHILSPKREPLNQICYGAVISPPPSKKLAPKLCPLGACLPILIQLWLLQLQIEQQLLIIILQAKAAEVYLGGSTVSTTSYARNSYVIVSS